MSKQIFEDIGVQFSAKYGTSIGLMFGKSCLKTGKKAFAAFFNEEMVFKLGQKEIKLLLEKYPGSKRWDPSGKNRQMKDWFQVPAAFESEWESLAKSALDFVDNL